MDCLNTLSSYGCGRGESPRAQSHTAPMPASQNRLSAFCNNRQGRPQVGEPLG